MRTVWKFTLEVGEWIDVEMGENEDHTTLVVLAAIDPQSGKPAVWIEGDDERKRMPRSFYVVGTGKLIPGGEEIEPVEHVGSMIDGQLVWHVYERTLYHGQAA